VPGERTRLPGNWIIGFGDVNANHVKVNFNANISYCTVKLRRNTVLYNRSVCKFRDFLLGITVSTGAKRPCFLIPVTSGRWVHSRAVLPSVACVHSHRQGMLCPPHASAMGPWLAKSGATFQVPSKQVGHVSPTHSPGESGGLLQ
jgi:hypothetical protein